MEEQEKAVLGIVGTAIAALVGAWGLVRGREKNTPAQTQEQINAGFEAFMKRADRERDDLRKEIVALRGEVRNLKQYNRSLVRALMRNNIEVPVYHFTGNGVVALPFEETGAEEDQGEGQDSSPDQA